MDKITYDYETVSFIIPSIGRPSLQITLDSIKPWPGDEVIVINHHRNLKDKKNWSFGGPERNEGIEKATCDYIAFMDDDDRYVDGAREILNKVFKENIRKKPLIFKMQYPSGRVLWDIKGLKCGRVGSPMIVIPNIKSKIPKWRISQFNDLHFVDAWGWHSKQVWWRDEIIALLGHEDVYLTHDLAGRKR